MRSRSYSAIATSSLLLLISCTQQRDDHKKDVEEPPRIIVAPEVEPYPEEARAAEKMAEEPHPHKEAGPAEPAPLRDDGCVDGEMPFEGSCRPKEEVQKVLRRREREALAKVQQARRPGQAAEAANDLLEQQISQAAKSEDDLDEIIEMLREEKRAKAEAKNKKGHKKRRGR